MKPYQRKIEIVTRPKESHGFYEYLMDIRQSRFLFFKSKELALFEKALGNISEGKNPSGWNLTRPSEKDFGLDILPFSENAFYLYKNDIFFFPNEAIMKEWFEWHWQEYSIEDDDKLKFIHGVKVKRIKGKLHE